MTDTLVSTPKGQALSIFRPPGIGQYQTILSNGDEKGPGILRAPAARRAAGTSLDQ